MPVESPVSERLTVVGLLLLTFATGIVDAVSVLALGHVLVANMTGNVIFLGFWFVPHSGVDMTAAVVAFASFVAGTVLGGRLARHIDSHVRLWLTVALGIEVFVLVTLSLLAGTGVLNYHDNTKLILTAGLAMTFGSQNATARQFGIQELSTTVLTSTIVGLGFDRRWPCPPRRCLPSSRRALTARRPRARYVVGVAPKLQVALMTNLPAPARDVLLRRVAGQP
jgi:uncharacterized membrane protein YoaK (UPF0700 family)